MAIDFWKLRQNKQVSGQNSALLMSNSSIFQPICMANTTKCWQTYPLLTSF